LRLVVNFFGSKYYIKSSKGESVFWYPQDILKAYTVVYIRIPEEYQMNCKYCQSENVTKKGFVKGKQLYKCKECGKRFFENGKFAKMRTDKRIIVAALNFYYDGLSLRKAERNIQQIFGETVTQVTILNWIKKYLALVKEFVTAQVPQLSGMWHEDETMLGVEGRNIWF